MIAQIDEIDRKIITIRHAKSVFNNSVVMKNGLTVGDNIIRLAILEREKSIYSRLATRQKKTRNTSLKILNTPICIMILRTQRKNMIVCMPKFQKFRKSLIS